jgi:hypothetical protein
LMFQYLNKHPISHHKPPSLLRILEVFLKPHHKRCSEAPVIKDPKLGRCLSVASWDIDRLRCWVRQGQLCKECTGYRGFFVGEAFGEG